MTGISITAFDKSYVGKRVVRGFDLDVAEGEFVSLLGPSGCGKTTILRAIAGFEQPDAGSIEIENTVVDDQARRIFVPPNRRNLGMVFQNYALWPHMSVEANVAYPLKSQGYKRSRIGAKVGEVLDLVGLAGFERRAATALSGGQQQRVALARALVSDPAALLLDEPLSNLDAQRRNHLRGEFRRIHRTSPRTTVYVTHDQVEALSLSDRVVVMSDGQIQQMGSPGEVFTNPVNEFVAQFLGYENLLDAVVTRVDGAVATVRLPGEDDETLAVRASGTWTAGSRATVAVRSSDVSVHPATGGVGEIAGVIEDAIPLGQRVEYSIRHGSDRLTVVTDLDDFTWALGIGSPVRLHLNPLRAVLVPSSSPSI